MNCKPLLTATEWAYACLLARGLSRVEMAETQGVSTETVKSHVSEIIRKTGAADKTDAVVRLLRCGELTFEQIDRSSRPKLALVA